MVHILSIFCKTGRFMIDEMFQRNAKKMVTLLLDTKNLKEFKAFGRNISLSTYKTTFSEECILLWKYTIYSIYWVLDVI